MACQTCGKAKYDKGIIDGINKYPFGANDISVVENDSIHRFSAADWNNDVNKLIIFLPEIFTYTCSDQIKGMKKWYDEFKKLDCELLLCMTDSAVGILDWFNAEPLLKERPYKAFSSYMLPVRLGMINNGRAKRGAVFITKDGELVKQEAFEKIAPSFSELHRILWAHSTGQYCGSDWVNPESGFLNEEPV